MEKINHSQLELFSNSKDHTSANNKAFSNPCLGRIWRYEKIILTTISLMVTGIVSFSFGVEKGKRIVMLSDSPQTSKIQSSISVRETAKSQYQPITQRESAATELPKIKELAQNYIIQLASYKTKTLAQKEARVLKNKGYSPLILSKSGYAVLYVGNFPNKEKAESLLSELKKRYRDCLIRRL